MIDEEPILRTDGLKKYFDTSEGFIDDLIGRSKMVRAVDGVDLELKEGETLGVVGESGCGKTTLGRSILRLLEPSEGSVYYKEPIDDGTGERTERQEVDLTEVSESRLRDLRTDLQYIFQDPFSSLNPRMTVGDIIGEPLDIHDIAEGQERTERIHELLETVGLNPSHVHRYPHEFSGGQRQRIGIARALAVDPDVIVADEPVSALDVSVQAQILNLLEDLQDEFGLSYILIAHDLSVVEHISDRVAVMYLGEFVEVGETQEVFSPPYHPYAEALLSAIPEPDPLWEGEQIFLAGNVPSPIDPPSGCRFHTRCPRVIQPAAYDLEQSEWRSIMDFKLRVRDAETIRAIVPITDEETTPEGSSNPADVPMAEFDHLVRDEFGLPGGVSDPAVEDILSDVMTLLHEENVEEAGERLEDEFESTCERHNPEQIQMGGSHKIACLRFDDEHEGEPPRSVADAAGAPGAK